MRPGREPDRGPARGGGTSTDPGGTMNPVRRLLIGFAAVAAAAVGLVAAPSPASASTADCFYGVGIYETHLGIPRKALLSGPVGPGQELLGQEVVVNGNIDVAGNTSCSKASVQFRLQT